MKSNQEKILILGASSYVGRHLEKTIGAEKCIGTYGNSPMENAMHFDALSSDLSDLIRETGSFSHAVILIGDTQPDSCYVDIKKSDALNVGSIKQIIDILISLNIVPVFASSEFVFDGEKGEYTEEDLPNPILVYGRQKSDIEKYLQKNCEHYTVLRLAKVYGETLDDNTIFTSWLHSIVNGNGSMRCAADQRFSPVFIGDVVSGICKSIDHRLKGTYHLAGPEGYTRLELLEILLNEIKKYRPVDMEVEPCSILDFGLPEKRPIDVSMKPDRLVKASGIQLNYPQTICERITAKYFRSV